MFAESHVTFAARNHSKSHKVWPLPSRKGASLDARPGLSSFSLVFTKHVLTVHSFNVWNASIVLQHLEHGHRTSKFFCRSVQGSCIHVQVDRTSVVLDAPYILSKESSTSESGTKRTCGDDQFKDASSATGCGTTPNRSNICHISVRLGLCTGTPSAYQQQT